MHSKVNLLHKHIYPLFKILFPYRLFQNTEYMELSLNEAPVSGLLDYTRECQRKPQILLKTRSWFKLSREHFFPSFIWPIFIGSQNWKITRSFLNCFWDLLLLLSGKQFKICLFKHTFSSNKSLLSIYRKMPPED